MVELRDVNLKLAENHQESVEIAEKTQKVISDVKSGQSTSINLLDNISSILRDQLKIQIKQAKILEGQRFDNLEAARENRRSMLRNARLGMAGAGAGAGAGGLGLGLGRGPGGMARRGFLAAIVDTIGTYFGVKEFVAKPIGKAISRNRLDIPDFRKAVEADASRFTNNRTRKINLAKINARAFPALQYQYQDELFTEINDLFGPKPKARPKVVAGTSTNAIELGNENPNQKLLEDLRKDPPKAVGANTGSDVKPDVSVKAGIGKFLLSASNALVAVEALYGLKIANEIRQVEKELDRKLSTAEVDRYLKETRGFKSLEEVLNERSDPTSLAGEGNYKITRLINNIMAKSKVYDPQITQADRDKVDDIISNSVANSFYDGLEQAIKENNITTGGGAVGDVIVNNSTGNNNTDLTNVINNYLAADDTTDNRYGAYSSMIDAYRRGYGQ